MSLYVAPCKEHAYEPTGSETERTRVVRCRLCQAVRQELKIGPCTACGKVGWIEDFMPPALLRISRDFVFAQPSCGHEVFVRCLNCTPGCPVCGCQEEYT